MQTQTPTTTNNGPNTQTGAVATPVPAGAAPQPRAQTGSLYVGDLDPDVGESLLFEIFSQVGPIISIRVCRDATTRRSLGYAYVNFRDVHDAERALDTLNYSLIKNRPCRIMWCQRDPTIRRSGVGNVFIKNLDRQIENKSLYDTFSNFGNILSCKVVTDEHGNSKGYGFIHYETKEAAEEAINTLNGMILNNKMVYVGPFIARKERKASSPEDTFTNVYVKNIDPSMDDASVRNLFAQFGPTTSVVVMRDNEGLSRGFGFVNFRNHEDAVRAVEALHGKNSYSDKTMFVCRAQKKAERREFLSKEYLNRVRENQDKYQGLNLYVKNLDDSVNDERLRQEFSVFGTITSAKVMVDDSNIPRGFGFVCFGKPDEASKALAEMHGKLVFGKPLYVAYAQRKDIRRAQLEAQYNQRNTQYFYPPQAGAIPLPGAIYPPGPSQYYPPGYPVQRPYVYPPQVRRWPGASGPGAAPPGAGAVPSGAAGGPGSGSGGPGSGGPSRTGPYQSMPNYNMSAANRPRNRQTRLPQTQPMPSQSSGPRGPGSGPSNRGGGGNIPRFSGNARNRRDAGYPPTQQPGVSNDPLDPKRLALMGTEDRKRVIGDTLFDLIQQEQIEPDLAKKITGMILASNEDQTELIHLIEDRTVLVEKVREALEILSKDSNEAEETA